MDLTKRTINKAYLEGLGKLLEEGEPVQRRNSICHTLSGLSISYNFNHTAKPYLHYRHFPILSLRKIHYRGVLGEFAAFVRKPKRIQDFKAWGCNYWDQFGDENGYLHIDYGNAWYADGINQLANVIEMCKKTPESRRIMMDFWRPNMIDELTLPCCHFAYQFVVHNGVVDLVWYQRSADYMVGIPSDMVLATLLLAGVSIEANLIPGRVTMHLGDAHIYKEHMDGAERMLNLGNTHERISAIRYDKEKFSLLNFMPNMIEVYGYEPSDELYKFKCIL